MAKDMRRCCEIVLITEKMQMSVYTGVGEIDSGDGCANGLNCVTDRRLLGKEEDRSYTLLAPLHTVL